MNEEQQKIYEEFFIKGKEAGFTDKQIEFMWEFIMETIISTMKMLQINC